MERVPNKYIRRAANAELSQRELSGVVVTSATVNRKCSYFLATALWRQFMG